METKFIRPVAGRTVRRLDLPNCPVLQAEGELVSWSPDWQRLLIDGDIEIFEPATDTKAKKSGGDA